MREEGGVNEGKRKVKLSRVGPPDRNTVLRQFDVLIHNLLHKEDYIVSFAEFVSVAVRARELLLSDSVLLRLSPPIYVFGDIHGQLEDLRGMLRRVGPPPKNSFLFLGDYVDRGTKSVETITLLLAFKLRYPDKIFLLRGNHETRLINRRYGFFDECLAKFGVADGLVAWTEMQHVFNCLSISALIGQRIFCVHGGLSDSLVTFKQFDRIVRPCDVGDVGLMPDLIWSDPSLVVEAFKASPRGAGCVFGLKAIRDFCHQTGVDLIVRAHQCVPCGHQMFGEHLLTIFSAPGYDAGNPAAILRVHGQVVKHIQICQILIE